MAKMILPTNFQDDIMNTSMGGKRRYRIINNTDGTISLEDVTVYDQVGSNFGAGQINQTNTAVNAAADDGRIIDDMNTIMAVTEEGYMAGALVAKQLNQNFGGVRLGVTEDGQPGYITTGEDGADAVVPFSGALDDIENVIYLPPNKYYDANNLVFEQTMSPGSYMVFAHQYWERDSTINDLQISGGEQIYKWINTTRATNFLYELRVLNFKNSDTMTIRSGIRTNAYHRIMLAIFKL